jgi:Holliday junction resolvase-like predicted endonuclease
MSESDISHTIINRLNATPGCHAIKFHGDQHRIGECDILACVRGHFVAIEVKKGDEKSKPVQRSVQWMWRRAGALVLSDVTSADEVMTAIDGLINIKYNRGE